MTSQQRRKKRRLRLFKNNPFCHWCNCKLVWIDYGRGEKFKQPNNIATIDHFYHKGDPRRVNNTIPSVLACGQCNKARGTQHNKEMQLKEKQL